MGEAIETDDEFDAAEARKLVVMMNRKKRKSGGFQVMGFSPSVFRGLTSKGYKLPTPIQRKTIPIILTGRDVVAMARTGSGKTAAFLLPMFERLQRHVSTGSRAIILSPTRELALQTLNFTKELGKFTGLTAAVILGGEKMEEQFSALHSSPDIIIATPGRLLHVIMEMNFSLKTIQYVVFDEGDRLFELGFAEQLSETLRRLPRDRQTLIFSATLPNNVIDFARAGLTDPVLIRLDVDSKLNRNLKLVHIGCLPDEKNSLLFYFLQSIAAKREPTVVFFGTKHHVEFFQALLTAAGLRCGSIHSGLDPAARTAAIKQFNSRRFHILLVTDVAARGVDIPLLDNVINYHFPSQPKLFLHRVGRVARAGRTGTAYSLIEPDELSYLIDVFVFLGRSLKITITNEKNCLNDMLGRAPRVVVQSATGDKTEQLVRSNASLASMGKVCSSAMKRYIKTRPKASSESVLRAKQLRGLLRSLPIHPIFPVKDDEQDCEVLSVIRGLKLPTIFEALGRQANPSAYDAMLKKRRIHKEVIARHAAKQQRIEERDDNKPSVVKRTAESSGPVMANHLHEDIEFGDLRHTQLFIPYSRGDDAHERGLSVSQCGSHFSREAAAASFDLMGDELLQGHQQRPGGSRLCKQVWDRKRKRYTNAEAAEGKANMKRIKTESGVWISASYKTDKYKQWLKRSHADQVCPTSEDTRNIFSARFGGVVEFSDESGPVLRKGRKEDRNEITRTTGIQSAKVSEESMTVLGIQPWYERAVVREHEKKQNAIDRQKIRQPKGSRTFGQLRRPEQILKRGRQRAKVQQASQRKRTHGKQSKHGPNLRKALRVKRSKK